MSDEGIRVVRLGHGANCSSLGSVIDTLFVTAVVGGVVFAAVASALEREAGETRDDAAKALDDAPGPDEPGGPAEP